MLLCGRGSLRGKFNEVAIRDMRLTRVQYSKVIGPKYQEERDTEYRNTKPPHCAEGVLLLQ